MEYNINNLIHTIEVSTSPFHTALEAKKQLCAAGFSELFWNHSWQLVPGQKYFTSPYGTSLFAFKVSSKPEEDIIFKLASAHIDSPGLRIKSNPGFNKNGYQQLNTEVYGGAIYNTWLDRPLSIAGRIALKNNDSFHPIMKLIDFRRPVIEIPNLAFHLNRKVNEGIPLNPQIDLLPICGTDSDSSGEFLQSHIACELDVSPSDILAYDLCIYNYEACQKTGFGQDMLLAPRIDNLSSVQACLSGIINSEDTDGIDMICLFDHEEIGNRSKNGAFSSLLSYTLERICDALNISREQYLKNICHSFFVSLDVAHAVNPNHPDCSDITTGLTLNHGFAIKCSSKQVYCSDSEMTGTILQLSHKYNLPCQPNYLRSDSVGGGTVGPIISSTIPMNCADIGIPILAMHSAMETAGIMDQLCLEQFMQAYFTTGPEWR